MNTNHSITHLKSQLRLASSPSTAASTRRFFKTGPGEYAEGDVFIGVSIPDIRRLAKSANNLSYADLKSLFKSPIHEERLLACLILCEQYKIAKTPDLRHKIHLFYLSQKKHINNWDLVDLTAAKILGRHCVELNCVHTLEVLLHSKVHWDRRISIVATHAFIKEEILQHTFKFAAQLLEDKEDLMHKATGWMLRETGKINRGQLKLFLKEYGHKMPRTMLRYAIEHFPESERKRWLKTTPIAPPSS